jgi:hypothetical protein
MAILGLVLVVLALVILCALLDGDEDADARRQARERYWKGFRQ